MKCPICKAWTVVKETRLRSDGSRYRRYECANLHRFTTRERLETVDQQKLGPGKPRKHT